MSDLNSGENGGLVFTQATKIDPRDSHPHEEKLDTPKEEASSTSAGSSQHYFRDVYSSSPEEDDLDLESEAEDKFIEITISEPHKVGDGISSFMAYRVATKTNMKLFKRESFSVTRRFSDFLGE